MLIRLTKWVFNAELGRYALVGALIAGFYFATLFVLMQYTAAPLPLIIAMGYGVATVVRFVLHRYWVFDAQEGSMPGQLQKYVVLLVGVYATNVIITESLIRGLQMPAGYAAVAATVLTTLAAYLVSSKWVFK